MITTLTMNPTIDYRFKVDKLKIGKVNRIRLSKKESGGKGINVAKYLNKWEQTVKAVFCAGDVNGQYIVDELQSKGIETEVKWLKNKETRINFKLTDNNGEETKLNQEGTIISDDILRDIKKRIIQLSKENKIINLGGSLPPEVPSDFYKKIIDKIDTSQTKVFVDTSGEPLKLALEANPTLIKPNVRELEEITNKKLNNYEIIIEESKKLIDEGLEMILVSMGDEGAFLISEDKIYQSIIPRVEPKSTVGAGDSMVAGMAFNYVKDVSLKEMFKFSVAASISTISHSGTETGTLSEVKKWMDEIQIKRIRKEKVYH